MVRLAHENCEWPKDKAKSQGVTFGVFRLAWNLRVGAFVRFWLFATLLGRSVLGVFDGD